LQQSFIKPWQKDECYCFLRLGARINLKVIPGNVLGAYPLSDRYCCYDELMPKSILHHPSKPLLSSGNGLFIAIFLLTMVHKTETKSRIRFYTWSCLSAIKGRLIKASLKKSHERTAN
jgi:hypothetical protein